MREHRNHHLVRKFGQESGVTLIELLIVVGIIAVISAIAYPSVTSFLRIYRLNNDARAILGEINIARMRAASSGARTEVICDTSATGPTALTCGIAIRKVDDAAFHGFLPSSLPIIIPGPDMPTQVRLTGTDSFGFPPAALRGAGTSQLISHVAGQYEAAPYNCGAVVFNSRGIPIYDSLANISGPAPPANACATLPLSQVDGQRKSNYVMYLQSGQTTYLAVAIDGSGVPTLWRWDSVSATWKLSESGKNGNGT